GGPRASSPPRSGSPDGPGCSWSRTAGSWPGRAAAWRARATTTRTLTAPSVEACRDDPHAHRSGDGIGAPEDPAVVKRLAADWVTCEVCPSSNVALGVAAPPAPVPPRRLLAGGVRARLGRRHPL